MIGGPASGHSIGTIHQNQAAAASIVTNLSVVPARLEVAPALGKVRPSPSQTRLGPGRGFYHGAGGQARVRGWSRIRNDGDGPYVVKVV